ncbi:stonustoxin subunit alpha-like [Cheilinus undulatus]|uniref:stonustoxin subunit alpha-like n=1 Tax=Cheilinus undulatus TaxID=241271 RepID=UPI001BD2AA50|nr:stonustoxin subunit alpha-like [Cheilinus undulatus]
MTQLRSPSLTPLRPIVEDACPLEVDTNTVHRHLKLSDNNTRVACVQELQLYPDHPDRFLYMFCLLCRTGLTGRCYWEVDWNFREVIAVSYRGIGREDSSDGCSFGKNDKSWVLACSDATGYCVSHNKKEKTISSPSPSSSPASKRVAVYLDHPAGTLSFYKVSSDTLIHIHTYNTTFTEPVYPGFGFWTDTASSLSLCPL